jgi:hypothetical protein
MRITVTLFNRIAKCPVANSLGLAAVILFGISFCFAIEQTTVMSSALARPIIALLIGMPTLAAIMAIIFGFKCRMGFPRQEPGSR